MRRYFISDLRVNILTDQNVSGLISVCGLYDLAIVIETSWLLFSLTNVCTKMFKSNDDSQIDVCSLQTW